MICFLPRREHWFEKEQRKEAMGHRKSLRNPSEEREMSMNTDSHPIHEEALQDITGGGPLPWGEVPMNPKSAPAMALGGGVIGGAMVGPIIGASVSKKGKRERGAAIGAGIGVVAGAATGAVGVKVAKALKKI
jgi:hypothetical protein